MNESQVHTMVQNKMNLLTDCLVRDEGEAKDEGGDVDERDSVEFWFEVDTTVKLTLYVMELHLLKKYRDLYYSLNRCYTYCHF